jgi:molecular chaperone Hsp33
MADKIIRATAAGAQIRVFVADTKETVMTAYEKHDTYPVMTAALGRLLTAGALMGAMLKNEGDRLTLKIDGDGPGAGLVVAADYLSHVKGYAVNPHVDIPLKPNGKLDVSGALGNGTLTVIKDMGLKEPYVGTTNLVTGEIAEDITYYFSLSEQIPSSVGLGVLVDTDCSVKCAGGFILQLMPFANDETIDKLEANLKNISSVTSMYDSGMTAKDILYKLLDGFDVEINDEIAPEYRCDCSRERVENALSLIAKDELEDMIKQAKEEDKPAEVHCDFCNTDYYFTKEDLERLLGGKKDE